MDSYITLPERYFRQRLLKIDNSFVYLELCGSKVRRRCMTCNSSSRVSVVGILSARE